jgi:hypothetical protein
MIGFKLVIVSIFLSLLLLETKTVPTRVCSFIGWVGSGLGLRI